MGPHIFSSQISHVIFSHFDVLDSRILSFQGLTFSPMRRSRFELSEPHTVRTFRVSHLELVRVSHVDCQGLTSQLFGVSHVELSGSHILSFHVLTF